MKIKIDQNHEVDLDEILSDTVQDLIKALPQMIRQRDTLTARAEEMNAKIVAAQNVIRAFGPRPQPQQAHESPAATVTLTPSGRAPQGLVFKHVEETLKDGRALGFNALRAELEKRFGLKYGISSIYRALRKGEAEKRYQNKDGKWIAKV